MRWLFFQSILTICHLLQGFRPKTARVPKKYTVEPPVSAGPLKLSRPSGRLRVVATYESLDYFV